MARKSVFSVILSKIFGFLFFLLMVYVANLLTQYIDSEIYTEILHFINRNFTFLVITSLILMLGEIFFAIYFPFNLPAPLFSSIGSIMIVTFIGKIFLLVDSFTGENIYLIFRILSYVVYPLVFLIVLIGGYISIFFRLFTPAERPHKPKDRIIDVKPVKSWHDIGNEFRQLIYDFLNMLRKSIKKK